MWNRIMEKTALSLMNTKMVHQRKTIIMPKGQAIKWKKFPDVSVHLENSIGDNFQQAFLTNSNNNVSLNC